MFCAFFLLENVHHCFEMKKAKVMCFSLKIKGKINDFQIRRIKVIVETYSSKILFNLYLIFLNHYIFLTFTWFLLTLNNKKVFFYVSYLVVSHEQSTYNEGVDTPLKIENGVALYPPLINTLKVHTSGNFLCPPISTHSITVIIWISTTSQC